MASAKGAGLVEIRLRGLHPDEVGVVGVGEAAGDAGLDAVFDVEEALRRPAALAVDKRLVAFVHVGRDERGRVGVGAGDEDGRHAGHVGREAGRVQLADELARRDEDFAAEVAALLLRGQLVLEVNTGRAGRDHRFHQLVGVQRAAEARLGVGHDGREVVRLVEFALGGGLVPRHLVGAEQRVVDALDDDGDGVGGVEALVGIHVAGQVGVGGDLPAGEVDRLEAGLDLLHGLAAGHGAEGVDVVFLVHQLPQALGAERGERVLDLDGAAEVDDVGGGVVAADAFPARVGGPLLVEVGGVGLAGILGEFHGCGRVREREVGRVG